MSSNRSAIWKAALISGVPLGVVAAIPVVGTCLNVCCCGLATVAGLCAGFLYLSETEPTGQAPYGGGALTGLLTGAVGAAVLVVLTGLFRGILAAAGWTPRVTGLDGVLEDADLPPSVAEVVETYLSGASMGIVWLLGAFAVWLVVYGSFGCLGSVLGVAMFHNKREGSPQFGPPPGAPPAPPATPGPPPPPPATPGPPPPPPATT